jgi:hypothetical protein
MPYTPEQRQQIVQWMTQRVPRLMQQGCPLCGASASSFGVEQLTVPGSTIPLLMVACRVCGYIMTFNESMILSALSSP